MCRNRGFFDSIEIGEVVVEGSVRLLGRDCGNIGISGEEVIWVVIEDVPRVVFIVTEAEVGVDGESEGMKALAAHLTGVSCGWLLVVLLLELGVECIVGFVDGEKIADVSLREMFHFKNGWLESLPCDRLEPGHYPGAC